jgi:phosphoglycolate phosphatase
MLEFSYVRCIESALKRLNYKIPTDLDWCIGPPLQDSFLEILNDRSKIDIAIKYYRERFSKIGVYENKLYRGAEDCLFSLQQSKYQLFLATSKPIIYASRILKHFNLTRYFFGEYGSELDGTRKDKTNLINYILEKESLNPSDIFMIGDRKYDLIGAKNNNISMIGVSYGYGSLTELENESLISIVASPMEIVNFFKQT